MFVIVLYFQKIIYEHVFVFFKETELMYAFVYVCVVPQKL